jgi:hypothetical protein
MRRFEALGDDPLDTRRLSNAGSHRSSEAAQIHACCNQTGPGRSQDGGIKFFWMSEDNGLASELGHSALQEHLKPISLLVAEGRC